MLYSNNNRRFRVFNNAGKFVLTVLSILIPVLLFSQNSKAPTGKEISEQAKKFRLLENKQKTDTINGKKVRFIPAILKDSTDQTVRSGVLLGVLENEIKGDETGLAPGHYNIYLAQVNKRWHVYAESNGVIRKEAVRVSIRKLDQSEKHETKVEFIKKGWGILAIRNDMFLVGGSGTIVGYGIGQCHPPLSPNCGLVSGFYF